MYADLPNITIVSSRDFFGHFLTKIHIFAINQHLKMGEG